MGVGQGGRPGLTPFSLQLLAVVWRKQPPGLPGSPRLGQEPQGGNWGLGGRQGELERGPCLGRSVRAAGRREDLGRNQAGGGLVRAHHRSENSLKQFSGPGPRQAQPASGGWLVRWHSYLDGLPRS